MTCLPNSMYCKPSGTGPTTVSPSPSGSTDKAKPDPFNGGLPGEYRQDIMPFLRNGAKTAGICEEMKFWQQIMQQDEKAVKKDPKLTSLKPKIMEEVAVLQKQLNDQVSQQRVIITGLSKHAENIKNDANTLPLEMSDPAKLGPPNPQAEPKM
jgi:hypothetical protein